MCGLVNAQKTFVTPRNINELIHRALGVRGQGTTLLLGLLQQETSRGRALEPQVSRRMNEATQTTLPSFADGPRVGRSASLDNMCSVLVLSIGQTRSQTHYSRHKFRTRPDVR